MNSKILLLSIAVISVGLFAMPSTLSLFAGQHTFYNGSSVNCGKCHLDIITEASSQGGNYTHKTILSNTGRAQCAVCHTTGSVSDVPIGKNTSNAGNYIYDTKTLNVTNNSAVHAAVTVACISCHTNVSTELQGSAEAHGAFYNASAADSSGNNTNILTGGNEACVGCHTHIWVNVTWKRSVGYELLVNESVSGTYVINITAVNATQNTTYSSGQ